MSNYKDLPQQLSKTRNQSAVSELVDLKVHDATEVEVEQISKEKPRPCIKPCGISVILRKILGVSLLQDRFWLCSPLCRRGSDCYGRLCQSDRQGLYYQYSPRTRSLCC